MHAMLSTAELVMLWTIADMCTGHGISKSDTAISLRVSVYPFCFVSLCIIVAGGGWQSWAKQEMG